MDINKFLLDRPDYKLEGKSLERFEFLTTSIKPQYRRLRAYGWLSNNKKAVLLKANNSSIKIVKDIIKIEKSESMKRYCWSCEKELDFRLWEWFDGFISRSNFAVSSDVWNCFNGLAAERGGLSNG